MIANAYHVPEAPVRLLSPQHWAQQAKDNSPTPRGTWCATYESEVVLQWNQRAHTKTIPLDPRQGNVAVMWSTPGYSRYRDHIQLDEDIPICYATTSHVTDEEDDGEYDEEPEEPPVMHELADKNPSPDKLRENPISTTFDLNGPITSTLNPMEPDDLELHLSALMLRWHHRLSHISMKRIRMMAANGQLPKSLATCHAPMCQACQYGKASRRKWRAKHSLKTQPNIR
jgi:GAG-pre-integrase domain